jgi:hypothetical protein
MVVPAKRALLVRWVQASSWVLIAYLVGLAMGLLIGFVGTSRLGSAAREIGAVFSRLVKNEHADEQPATDAQDISGVAEKAELPTDDVKAGGIAPPLAEVKQREPGVRVARGRGPAGKEDEDPRDVIRRRNPQFAASEQATERIFDLIDEGDRKAGRAPKPRPVAPKTDWVRELPKRESDAARDVVEAFLKLNADDPQSVDILAWNHIIPAERTPFGKECDTAVFVGIRMKNKYGAFIRDEHAFFIRKGKVVQWSWRSADPLTFDVTEMAWLTKN